MVIVLSGFSHAAGQIALRTKLIELETNSSGAVSLQAPFTASRYTLTMPDSIGVAGAVLSTSGGGNLQWTLLSGSDWSVLGNAGLDSTVSYLGSRAHVIPQPLIIRTGGLERMRVVGGSGFVGIGASQPTAQLHVRASVPDAAAVQIRNASTGSGNIIVAENGAGAGVLVLSSAGNLGVGSSTTPQTAMSIDGGLTLRSNTVNVTADNQLITIGNRSFLILNSNNPPVYRTIVLSNGLQVGQMLLLLVTGGAGSGVELVDNVNSSNANLTAAWLPENGDTLQLIWDGADWIELSRSNN
jgi:hypothetical protein